MVKTIRMLLLAVTMALLAMAAVGAASASATVLCKENSATCAAEDIYPSGTSVSASLEANFELDGNVPLNCTGSTLSGETKAEKGTHLPIEVSGLTLSGCTGCPFGLDTAAETVNFPSSAELTRTSEGNGTFTVFAKGESAPSLKITCTSKKWPTKITCAYSLDGFELGFDVGFNKGNPANLIADEAEIERVEGGEVCGESTLVNAMYALASPKPAYATAGPGAGETVFCDEAGAVCPSSDAVYPEGTLFEAEASGPEIEWTWGSIVCPDSTLTMENNEESGNPLDVDILSFGFSACEGGCSTVEGVTPMEGSVNATSGGNGTQMIGIFSMKLSGCLGSPGITCEFQITNLPTEIIGGTSEEAKVKIETLLVRTKGPQACGEEMVFSGEYHFTVPLWVSKAEI